MERQTATRRGGLVKPDEQLLAEFEIAAVKMRFLGSYVKSNQEAVIHDYIEARRAVLKRMKGENSCTST